MKRSAGSRLLLATNCGCFVTAALAQPLEVVIQSGHTAEITDVAFSPNGCYVATAGADNRVKLWDETTGKEIRSLSGGPAPHTAVTFAPSGALYVGTQGSDLTAWDVSGERIGTFASGATPSIMLTADGRWMVTGGSMDPTVGVWDTESGTPVAAFAWNGPTKPEAPHLPPEELGIDHAPQAVAISPTGEYVASAGSEGRTALWHAGEAAPVRFYRPEAATEAWLTAANIVVAFSPDGRYLVGASRTTGYLWPVDGASAPITLEGQTGAITAIAFSDDGAVLATGSSSGFVWLWDAGTGENLGSFSANSGAISAIAFKPTGPAVSCQSQLAATNSPLSERVIATTGHERVARVWSLSDGSLIRALTPKVQPLNSVSFSSDGTKLALASSADPTGSAKVWDLTSGYDVTVLSPTGPINSLAFSPDGKLLVTGGAKLGTIVWDAQTLAPIADFGGAPGADGVPLTEAEIRKQRWLKILEGALATWAMSNEDLRTFLGNSSILSSLTTTKHSVATGPRAFAFDPQGRYIAIGGESDTMLWNISDRSMLPNWSKIGSVQSLTFAPDGESVVAVNGMMANRRSVTTGKEIGRKYTPRIETGSPVAVALHPSGQRIVLGQDPGMIELRDLDPSVPSLQRLPIEHGVSALQFSPDGSVLVVGDSAGTVTVFDYDGQLEERFSFEAHTDTIFAAAFNPKRPMLATASSDGTARLWNTDTWAEIVTFVSIGSEDYVILAPDNHYAASTNGYYGLAFRRGNSVFPFEQFDLQLNRPDLVFERLGTVSFELIGGYREAYAKRLKRMNVTPTPLDDDARVPLVRIEDLPPRATTTDRTLAFTLAAQDSAYPIQRLHVWVNDVPLYGSAGLALTPPRSSVRQPVTLQLSAGRNKVQVAALNTHGAESVRATIETIYTPPPGATHDLYVVAIGVSEYKDARFNLAYAAKDASDLIAALSAQQRFGEVHALPILNADATRDRILAVKQQLMNTRVDDEVVVFVAGHGMLDDHMNYFFGTHDIDFANPALRGISDDELEGLLDGIPARQKLLLMDTCFSGDVDTDSGAAEERTVATGVIVRAVRGIAVDDAGGAPARPSTDAFHLMERVFANLGRGSGSALISASGGNEFAFESTGNGVFTYSILEAIQATDEESFLRLSDLRTRIVSRVRQLTHGRQTPSIRRVNLDFDYPVYSVETPVIPDLPAIRTDYGSILLLLAEQGLSNEQWKEEE